MPHTTPRTLGARSAATLIALSLIAVALPGLAYADEPDPTPTPAASDTASPTETEPATPAESTSPTPKPTATLAATPVPSSKPRAALSSTPALSLQVNSSGSPVSGQFYEDLGRFAITGTASPATAGQRVQLYLDRTLKGAWVASTAGVTGGDGTYALGLPATTVGTIAFQTKLVTAAGAVAATSPPVRVTVRDATITLRKPSSSIDSLRNPVLTGYVTPARADVRVALEVLRAGRWSTARTTITQANGRFSGVFAYGQGQLARYSVRATYRAVNRARSEVSTGYSITRAKVLSAVITATTSAEVAKTYRSGCPVGPSRLRTIALNYYGFDRRMHRGVIIIRKDLADDLVRGFTAALKAGYPIAKMNNPNVYGGNDPRQMEANNTSGFNCRKVVGNPLRQSPHSYGIAIDVNTVQNPYRDVNGKWWPKNGKKYIDRSPRKRGMLTKGSALTKRLKKDKFFWGGRWNPGRDYQHYERR